MTRYLYIGEYGLTYTTPRPWRVAQNEWNVKDPPWRGAVAIEEDNEDARCLSVPGLLCWFTRPNGEANAALVVRAVNERDSLIASLTRTRAKLRDLIRDHPDPGADALAVEWEAGDLLSRVTAL